MKNKNILSNISHWCVKPFAYLKDTLVQSASNFEKVRSLVIMALLTALIIVLDQPFLSLQLGNGLKINFLFVPITLSAMFYGPIPCALVCVAGDLLGVLLTGKGVVVQLLLVEAVRGIILGFILFKKEPVLSRFVLSQSVANLFVNMCLNTAVLMQVGYLPKSNIFLAISTRLTKNIVLLPLEILILFFFVNSLFKAMKSNNLKP